MPDNQDPDSDQGDGSVGNSTVQSLRKQIKKLEDAAEAAQARADAAEAAAGDVGKLHEQLAAFQKAAAFDRLNIPPKDAGKLFRDTYQGELTDDAILAKAAEYGIVAPPSNTTAPSIPGVDMDAWARQQAAFNGTNNASNPNADDLMRGAKTTEELDEILARLGLLGTPQ